MEDLHEIRQDKLGVRHSARPIIVATGCRYQPLVHPHLPVAVCLEQSVSRVVHDHGRQRLHRAGIDPDVRVARATQLRFEIDGDGPSGRIVRPDVPPACILD